MVSFQKKERGFFSIVAFRQLTAKPLLTQLIKSFSFYFLKSFILGESLPYTRLKVKAPTNSLIRKLVK